MDFVENFDLTPKEDCSEEYVELRDGGTKMSPLIGRFCKDMPSTQKTTDNIAFIKFFTDTPDPKTGFKLKISLGEFSLIFFLFFETLALKVIICLKI